MPQTQIPRDPVPPGWIRDGVDLVLMTGGAAVLLLAFAMAFLPSVPSQSPTPKAEAEVVPYWAKTEQPTQEEVTVYATGFLQRLGIPPKGEVDCGRWAVDGKYKHYTCYAVVASDVLPMVLRCGPQTWDSLRPFTCSIHGVLTRPAP